LTSTARGGWSEAPAAKLVEEERRLEGLKGQRAVAPRPAAPRLVPDAAAIHVYLRHLLVFEDSVRSPFFSGMVPSI